MIQQMPMELFLKSCGYLRWGALLMGFILILLGIYIMSRPITRHKLYRSEEKNPRAVNMYLKKQSVEKGHLAWMLIICAIFIWYVGALVPSSYVTDFVVDKPGCPAGNSEISYYGSYNVVLLYPVILFGLGLLMNFLGGITHENLSKTLHVVSYLLLLVGIMSVASLFLYTQVCEVAAKCA